MKHKCRKNGAPVADDLGWPAYTKPGAVVRVADEDHWGLVQMRWPCCGTIDVEFSGFGDREPGVQRMTADELVSPYARIENAVPRGYPVPSRPGGPRRV